MGMVERLGALLEDLSKAKPSDTSAMVAVELEHCETHVKRVAFVPSHLQGDSPRVENNIPYKTTVFVPKCPEALDEIEEDFFNKSNDDKESLRELIEFTSKRPIVGSPAVTFSVFWRQKQAHIKMERLSMLKSLSCTRKGKIVTRNPNVVSITSRNASYSLTKNFCLPKTCSWSEGAQEKRCNESQARSSVDGVVKTWVSLTLVNIAAIDVSESTIWTAPVILTRVYGKLRALMKHIIGPSYSNYDLDLKFYATEWRIELFGFLYSREYDEINAKIAREGENLPEIMSEITRHRSISPSVSLDYGQLAQDYGIDEVRAKNVVALARKHQLDGDLQPLSLLDLNTPAEVNLQSEPDEAMFRTRAAQLGQSYGEDVNTYDAIEEICHTLMIEGFDRLHFGKIHLDWLKERLSIHHEHCSDGIIKYHALLQRTGGDEGWTFKRGTGESCIEPYIPQLLEANEQRMWAEVCFQGEHIVPADFGSNEGLTGLDPSPFVNWKEVSVLEFLNGCITGSKIPQLKGPTSQPKVEIISQRDENLTWTAAPGDGDPGEDVFLSKSDQAFMRTTGDIRVLYELRPVSMEAMCLAQFATQYRILNPSQESHYKEAYDKIVGEIDPLTGVGPDSPEYIAGTSNRAAPSSIKLRNGKIMVKRSIRAYAVPHLLYSGAVNKYSNIILWCPWRELESITCLEQEEIESATQRQTRLELFPLGVFQICQDEQGGEEDENLDCSM